MEEDKRKAMIPRPSGSIEKIGPGPRGILTRMVSDTLALARSRSTQVAPARFKIGKYEFCDPDYRQILLWAKALKLKPLTVIQRLERSSCKDFFQKLLTFSVENGAIVSLVWDIELLPLTIFDWVEGLSIREMAVQGHVLNPFQNSLRLPSLLRLKFSAQGSNKTSQIDLSNAPNLVELDCSSGLPDRTCIDGVYEDQTPTLDLSNLPNLTVLYCRHNKLTSLDIASVPNLAKLDCRHNELTEIDLSNVSRLADLDCSQNNLTEINLSNVPNLAKLNCRINNLSEINLSNVPGLADLDCHFNDLTEIDLSNVPRLTKLNCAFNELVELDLSCVPSITILDCTGTSREDSRLRNQITSLDLSNVPHLTKLNCAGNKLASLDLSNVPNLTWLMCGVSHCDMEWEIYGNELTELDLTRLPNLTMLSCNNNSLAELDLSTVPGLTHLHCGDNRLTELDLSNLPNLTVLECGENRITRLDLSRVPKLKWLDHDFGDVVLLSAPKGFYPYRLEYGGPGFDFRMADVPLTFDFD